MLKEAYLHLNIEPQLVILLQNNDIVFPIQFNPPTGKGGFADIYDAMPLV
jgi:hypothetical protein